MEVNTNQIQFIIRFFNAMAGTRYKFTDSNQEIVNHAINVSNGDLNMIKGYIKKSVAEGNNGLYETMENYIAERNSIVAKQEKAAEDAKQEQLSLALLSNVVTQVLAQTKTAEIEAAVTERLHKDVMQFVAEHYGPIQKKVEVQLGERKVELEGVVHKQFDNVLKFVTANEPVFLTGPAGSGKNVLCQQVAKTLGLEFYFSNAVTQEYKITGFTDANGTFHESQFYKSFRYGGLFMLDEMDASIPEVLIILNAAIANRYFDFPAPIGYVEAHPNFRVVAAGNTFGHGADYEYVGRNQLDAASLDRFAMVNVGYDEEIEMSCANGDAELLKFCRKFREATKKAGIRMVVSYRAIGRMAKLSQTLSKEDLIKTCLTKALGFDDMNVIKDDVSGCGSYSGAFLNVLSEMSLEVK